MAQLYKDPSAVGHFDAWALDAGTTKVDAVDDSATADADTTYVRTSTAGQRQSFYVPNVTSGEIPDGSTINWVQSEIDARRTTAGNLVISVYKGTSDPADISADAGRSLTSSYVTYTRQMTVDPFTTVPWTVATLRDWANALGSAPRSFGMKAASVTGAIRVTRLRVLIDYTAAAVATQPAWGVILG